MRKRDWIGIWGTTFIFVEHRRVEQIFVPQSNLFAETATFLSFKGINRGKNGIDTRVAKAKKPG